MSTTEFFHDFLQRKELSELHLSECSIENQPNTGKFDADPLMYPQSPSDMSQTEEVNWLNTLSTVLSGESEKAKLTFSEAINLHHDVFIKQTSSFTSHYTNVTCDVLAKHNLSIFRYINNPELIILYGLTPTIELDIACANSNRGDDYVIMEFAHGEHRDNIIGLFLSDTLLHIFFTPEKILLHESSTPQFPMIQYTPPFTPSAGSTLENMSLRLGYGLRYENPEVASPLSMGTPDLETLLADHVFQAPQIPAVYHRSLEQLFVKYTYELLSTMPTSIDIDESSVVEWLLLRDKTESLFMVVGQWKPSCKETLFDIDSRFPSHLISHILPSSRILSEAWKQDPMCWWGQGAFIHDLLSE